MNDKHLHIKELGEKTDAEKADQEQYERKAAAWRKDAQKDWDQWGAFPQSSNEDQAKGQAEYDKEWAKKFEKISYDTLKTTGAVTGRTAAGVSAQMAAGLNQIMKDQLGTLIRIEKVLKKDRPDNEKGIWDV